MTVRGISAYPQKESENPVLYFISTYATRPMMERAFAVSPMLRT